MSTNNAALHSFPKLYYLLKTVICAVYVTEHVILRSHSIISPVPLIANFFFFTHQETAMPICDY